jgi:predicted nucleic acid-binding protein
MDTNILIACERGTIDRSAVDEDELAVASISVAEYRIGIELADSPERAAPTGPDDHRYRGNKRFDEPLLQPRSRPLCVRNQRGAETRRDRR